MRVSHLILALCAALVTYLGVQIAVSSGPDSAYSKLESYHRRLATNVSDLEQHNQRLVATADLYRTDRRVVALAARELSYYDPDERVIRIPARTVTATPLSPGAIMRNRHESPDQRAIGALAALIVFLLALFIQIVADQEGVLIQRTRRASR